MIRLDHGLVVSDEVVVQLDAARLLLLDHDIADLQEDSLDLRVVVVESLAAVRCTRALVGLKDDQELSDKLLALGHQVVLVQVDAHIIVTLKDLDANNVALLLLVKVLEEDIGALGVRLTPLLRLRVVELQAEHALSELAHHRCPEEDIDLVLRPAEEGVDVGKLAEVEAAGVCTALLVAGGDGAELAVPGFTLLVARLVRLPRHWVSESWSRTICVSVDELADTVAE